MERMMQNLVHGNVVKCVLQRPVGQRVAVTKSARFPGCLVDVQPSPLVSLPPGPSSNDDLGSQVLKPSLEGLDLAQPIVLLDIGLPQVSTVHLVVHGLGLSPIASDSLSHRDVRFEIVLLLCRFEE